MKFSFRLKSKLTSLCEVLKDCCYALGDGWYSVFTPDTPFDYVYMRRKRRNERTQ